MKISNRYNIIIIIIFSYDLSQIRHAHMNHHNSQLMTYTSARPLVFKGIMVAMLDYSTLSTCC